MQKLAIIGASYLQLPVILKAKEMGIETHCFAWEEGAFCKDYADYFYPVSILEKEKILDICQKIKINGITTIATDMAVPSICFVAEKLNLLSNSYESAIKSTNKFEMRKAFLSGNCSIPKFSAVSNPDNIEISHFSFPLIVKPIDRSGSKGVSKVNQMDELHQALQYAISESFAGIALMEEYIEGDEVSVESISWNGEHTILTITDKVTTGEPFFVELAHHQPSQHPPQIQEKIREETIKCLNTLGVKYGAGHSEFKITKEGKVFAIEVGARMGGDFIGSHLVMLSTGYDFLKGVIEIALGKYEEPVLTKMQYSGVYFLSKETEFLLPYFHKENEYDVVKEIQNMELKHIHNSNERSGYLIYKSTDKVNLSA